MAFILFLVIDVLLGWGIYGDSSLRLITFQGVDFHLLFFGKSINFAQC